MSYNSWHIYGYGLCVSDIEGLSTEKIQALLAKAPEYQKDVQGWLEEHDVSEPTVDDYAEVGRLRPCEGGELLMSAPIILCDTAGMTNERWLECRAHGPKGTIPYTVGGSDVAAIFGVSPWTTPLELWMIKKGRMKAPVKSNQEQLMMGHLLEPIAAYWYRQKTGNTVYDDTYMYQHADHPWALADFDRRFTRKEDNAPGILECKSCTYHKAGDWADDAYPIYYELQLRFYLAVADVENGAFSTIWGNNPEHDLAMPALTRDRAKEDMIFQRLEEWIWSLEHDKPPTMADVKPALALESLARIYGASQPGLPTIEFPAKYEKALRQIALLQGKISDCNAEIKTYEREIAAHSVRIAELMQAHEHGVLSTTGDKLLIDFVTKTTKRPDSKLLKEKYDSPDITAQCDYRRTRYRQDADPAIPAGYLSQEKPRSKNYLLCAYRTRSPQDGAIDRVPGHYHPQSAWASGR